jgi:hypothetical protein
LSYEPKTWVDRVTEHPTWRRLTDTGVTDVKEVAREEGTITAEGDKINATNLNGFDGRVNDAFIEMGVDAYTCTKTGTVYDLKNSNSPVNGRFSVPADYAAGDTFRINPTDQLFNKDLAVSGFINDTDGTLNSSAVSNYSSPLIIISPSTAYKIVGHTYTQPVTSVGLAWYDSSGVYISGANYGGATGNDTYTSPATAYYIRYTINTIDLTVSLLELNTSTNTDVTYTAATTAQLQDGESLPDEFFKTGATVPFIYDISGEKLNFKSAGSTAEIFNFPLTISETEPTPLATGHIWVDHADVSDFTNVVLDDSARVSYTNGYLMLIVDDTNNGEDNITQPKKVSGQSMTFESHRYSQNSDTLSWQAGNYNKAGTISDIKRKYPVVYSRLDDVLNIETAYVWNGSAWVMISQQGSYLAVAHANSPYITIYNHSGDTFPSTTTPSTLPTGTGVGCAFSTDGTYLAVAHGTSPYITIYKRSGDTYTKLADPAALPTGVAYSCAFSTDGIYLAVATYYSPFILVYKRSGDTFTKLADPSTLPTGIANGCAFSTDDTYLAVAHAVSPYITIYKRSGDTFTKLTDPSTLPTDSGEGCAFSTDGTYLAVATYASPYIMIYKRSGDTFTKLTDPSILPTGLALGCAFSTDDTYLAVAHGTSPYITIYKRSGDTFTKLADPATLPAGVGRGCAFSIDNTYLAVAHDTIPYITIYKRSEDTFTKLSNPATLPTGNGNACAFLS